MTRQLAPVCFVWFCLPWELYLAKTLGAVCAEAIERRVRYLTKRVTFRHDPVDSIAGRSLSTGVPRRSMTALERGNAEGCNMELKIEIRKGDQVLRVVTVPDPRDVWCEHFNRVERMRSEGIQAYPVSSETRRASSKRREA